MTVAIRPVAEKDIEGLHAALDAVSREKKYLGFLEAPPLESARKFVMDNMRNDNPQFVALSGDDVVGWCDITPAARPIHAHTGVLGIGVLAAFRGQGIGRKLMEAAIAKAKTKGLTRIEIGARESNANAMALYKKMGFEIEGLKRKAVRVDGRYEGIYMMALLL